MALVTIRINDLIISVYVTESACETRVRALQRKLSRVVVKRGRRPGCLRMARSAVVRKLIRRMCGIFRIVVISLMALPAIRIVKIVVSTDVATDARL